MAMHAIAALTLSVSLIGGIVGATAQTPAPKTAPTGPQLTAFKSGVWDGGAFANPGTTTLAYCVGVAPYNNGVTVAFLLSNTFQWGIALIDPSWNLTMGSKYPIAMAVDARASGTATAAAIGTAEVLIPLAPTVALFKDFMEGEKLKIEAAGGTYTFDLTNTSEMLPALVKCVEGYSGPIPVSSNPFVSN